MSAQRLKEVIALTTAYYGRDISDEVLKMYAHDLSDLDPEQCIAAYEAWRKNPKHTRAPFPAEIKEIICPQPNMVEEAREASARIVSAVRKFGYCNAKEAAEYIGDLGWAVVQMQGGWSAVCQGMNDRQIPALQAQYRDLAEGIYSKSIKGGFGLPPALPGNQRESQKLLEEKQVNQSKQKELAKMILDLSNSTGVK